MIHARNHGIAGQGIAGVAAALAIGIGSLVGCDTSESAAASPRGEPNAAEAEPPPEYPPEEPLEKVELTEDQWRERLTEKRFRILRRHGTERRFSGELLHNQREGVYGCAGCGLPLYHADAKYDSRTGWPSFFRAIDPDHVGTRIDRSYGMVRTEVHCARCGGHLGHVFEDGPEPTGLRHCINSAALTFTPDAEAAEDEAEPRGRGEAESEPDAAQRGT